MSYNAYDKDTDTIIDLSSDTMVDAVPTEGSTRPVSSGGVYNSIAEIYDIKLNRYQFIQVIENETVSVPLELQSTYILTTSNNIGKLARLIQTFNTGVWQDAVDFVTPSGAFNITYSGLTLNIESTGYSGLFALLKIGQGYY